MASTRVARLAHITDEVQELHPLLGQLLPKLPKVKNVEYTHGGREMGADFVFSKLNEVLGTVEYVGVIAKVGRILQDYSDIERQIDECEVPRNFLGGKEKIRINEVWVIVTGNITQNAQDKIHEKYKLRSIHFIDGSRLERLIDTYLPVFWTNIPVQVGGYLVDLRTTIQELNRTMSLVPLGDQSFYIEQDIQKVKTSEYHLRYRKPQHPEKVNIQDEIESNQLIFIEAGLGFGKSKLLRRLAEHYTEPEIFKHKSLLPIFVTYKDLIESFGADPDKLIASRINQEILTTLKQPKFLLLIDGVDEKNLPAEEQADTLKAVLDRIGANPDIKAVITSRPLKVFEHPGVLDRESYKYEICQLSLNKTIEFLQALCTQLNITKKIIEDLKKSQLFKEFPKSPIATILLARLLNENSKDLPSNMTDLYAKYIELILGRWEIEKGLETQKEYQALDNILMQIARHMIDNELPVLPLGDAKDICRSYLESRNLNISPNQLFERMLERCDILGADRSHNILVFKHRSFAEFFYAKGLLKAHAIHMDQRVFELYWMNIFFFYLGLLKDCPDMVEEISNLNPQSEAGRWLKVINMSNYLLAAYTTPYDVISKGLEKVVTDSARLYIDTVRGDSDSAFSQVPRMKVLYILQYLVRHSYSYEFFQKAIEEAALRIDSGPYDEEIKVYALFFLNVTYLELGEKESFEFLLKAHLGKLPLDLTLALMAETRSLKDRNALVKKQDKHTKRFLKGNPNLKSKVEQLFERPVGSERNRERKQK